jgi:hypothetical protein
MGVNITENNDYSKNKSGIYLPNNYTFFTKPTDYDMSVRKIEMYQQASDLIQWGRRQPADFAEYIFGIKLLDYQKYVFTSSWNKPYVVWCMGRGSGKSILGAIFLMTKSLLVPQHKSYILCGVGSQSIEMFTKLEQLTKQEIASFKGFTDIFYDEIVRGGNSDGFIHNPASFNTHLYNSSYIFTLNGSFDNNRSKRSQLNFYDEAGYSPDDLFSTSEPFCTQNSEFEAGETVDADDILCNPKPFPNQLIYASSASSTDSYFWRKYHDFSLHMFAGDRRYFVADISSDVVTTATMNGKIYPTALLTQETIDGAMRENKEKALREYKNIFTNEGGDGQIIRRAQIIKNSATRVPLLYNDTGKKKFAFAYDPARKVDNSVVSIGEFYQDEKVGWKLRIANVVSFVDIGKKKKTPMTTPKQIEALKQLILDFNGEKCADYENILAILVDAGTGGAGVPITDFLMPDWYEEGHENDKKYEHKGLVDKKYDPDNSRKFPNSVDKIKMLEPTRYKTEMFESLIEMVDLDLIEFTNDYDNKGFMTLIYQTDTKGNSTQIYKYPTEEEQIILNKRGIEITTSVYHLERDEELGLKQIDALKDEVVNMYRFKQASGKDRFDLAPDKANKMHDDRAYTIAMLGWYLKELRREHITKRKKPKQSLSKVCTVRKPSIYGNRYN